MEQATVKAKKREEFEHDCDQLLEKLIGVGSFLFGGPFKLRNAPPTDFYANIRSLADGGPLDDYLLNLVTAQLFTLIECESIEFSALAPVPNAATSFAEHLAIAWNTAHTRRSTIIPFEKRASGEFSVDTAFYFSRFDRVLLIENVTTTAVSCGRIMDSLEAMYPGQSLVRDALTVLDREEGACQYLASRGVKLHALFTKSEVKEFCRTYPHLLAETHAG